MPIQLICQWCGSTYSVSPYRQKTSRYCSRSHNALAHSSGLQDRRRQLIFEARVMHTPGSTIPMSNGELTRVSEEDYDHLIVMPWRKSDKYAVGTIDGKDVRMHNVILQRMLGRKLTKGELADHINHDYIDNRRDNLRLANPSLNGANRGLPSNNTSGYKGIYWQAGKWVAETRQYQQKFYIGRFTTAEEAAYAYDQVALQIFGEFALTNFEYI